MGPRTRGARAGADPIAAGETGPSGGYTGGAGVLDGW